MSVVAARCSCGTNWLLPVTKMAVALMVGHWRQGHAVSSETPQATATISAFAHQIRDGELAEERRQEAAQRASEGFEIFRADGRIRWRRTS